jgi:hypothetical protein
VAAGPVDLPEEDRRIEFWCEGPEEAVLAVALERVRRVLPPIEFIVL